MIDKDIVANRLSKIKESFKLLDFINRISREEFANNPDNFLKAERLLEIMVQAMIDISTHIIASKSLRKAEDYHEVIDVLVNAGVFSQKFSKTLHNLIGLRNLLVHEYLKIDRKRLYDNLIENRKDFKVFCDCIVKFIEKE